MVKRKAGDANGTGTGNCNGKGKKEKKDNNANNNKKYSKYKSNDDPIAQEKQLNGCVKKVTVLKKKNSEEAMQILQKCIKCTIKVIEKRSWKVSSINEFYPKEDNLLGLNINRSKIMVRMRPPHK